MIKYIFCVNPGRTGSEYVSTLFSYVRDVASFHEPKPILHGYEMREYLMGNPDPLNSLMEGKVSFIKENLGNKKYYFEANHCFIKGFGWLLPQYVPESEIGVIVLKRDRRLVVDSLYKVNAHPFTTTGEKWIIVPQFYRGNLVPFPRSYSKVKFLLHKLQYRLFNKLQKSFQVKMPARVINYSKELIGWYVDETYALGRAYYKKFPGIRLVELDLSELNTAEGFKKLLDDLDIPSHFTTEIESIVGKKVNEREGIRSHLSK